LEENMATQQGIRGTDMAAVSTGDIAEVIDADDMQAPEGYIPPDADVTESMPPQCSF
jgi:hypothetical protein